MSSRFLTLSLVAAVAGVGAFALLRSDVPSVPAVEASPTLNAANVPAAAPAEGMGFPASGSEHTHAAPPGAAGAAGAAEPGAAPDLTAPDEPPAITWTVPAAWKTAPNPSAMRVATYKVAHAGADTEDADVSVVRAGGTADANIARWREQFEGAVKETRTVKTVHGLKVTLVEINGTYLGGAGASATSRPGWSLVAAIVETPQLPYFFKLTGPAATARGARPSFDALVESIAGSP
jgi:hypothetical protein